MLTSAGCDAGQAQRSHKSILPCSSVKPVLFLLCHLWDFAESGILQKPRAMAGIRPRARR